MKLIKLGKLVVFFSIMTLCASCATVFNGTKARVVISDANVRTPVSLTVDGRTSNVYLPATIKVKRGYKTSQVNAVAPGYKPATIFIHKKFNPVTLWNIPFGIVPMAIDAATGALMKPESKFYYLNMRPSEPQEPYKKDPTIPQGEASKMVSRDAPGQTDLENTIIRWYFDSDPRGARIYWRVISSIPAIVKNTNETYLMTTPYEETRSFNILGLTYENSKDVQIEIKLSKRGYEDQVKRFNVRQAIDQQEVSGFFELVPKDEPRNSGYDSNYPQNGNINININNNNDSNTTNINNNINNN